jgi:hypothetical protein
VANAILYAAVEERFHGKGFFVGGDKITELETMIDQTRPQWMTPEVSDGVEVGWERLSKTRIMSRGAN